MSTKTKVLDIYTKLLKLYPNAACELNFQNEYELVIAVMLSAQTTDKSVNKVTEVLFAKYPSFKELAFATYDDIYNIIKSLGLGKTKASNIIKLTKVIMENYDGKVPSQFSELVKLPGVGRKCANVIMIEAFKIPAVPVDTHVERCSKRLGLACQNMSVLETEKELTKIIPDELKCKYHHLLINFGRYLCTAKNPHCEECPLTKYCTK